MRRASTAALIETDEALKSAGAELEDAEAQWGPEAAASIRTALRARRTRCRPRSRSVGRLDDTEPEPPEQRRAMSGDPRPYGAGEGGHRRPGRGARPAPRPRDERAGVARRVDAAPRPGRHATGGHPSDARGARGTSTALRPWPPSAATSRRRSRRSTAAGRSRRGGRRPPKAAIRRRRRRPCVMSRTRSRASRG